MQLAEIERKLSEAKEEKDILEKKLRETENELFRQQDITIAAKNKLEESTAAIDDLKAEADKYEKKISMLNNQKTSAENRFRELQRILKELELDSSYKENMTRCENGIRVMNNAIQSLFTGRVVDIVEIGKKKEYFIERLRSIETSLRSCQQEYGMIVQALEKGNSYYEMQML